MTGSGTGGTPSGYPAEWEIDALLADGAPVRIRPIRPDDQVQLRRFHAGLSAETVYRRFFSAHPVLSDDEVRRFTSVDYRDRFALVATLGEEMVAVARFERHAAERAERAEVAFVVADRHQGRGLGSLLLEQLAGAAAERGIRWFDAETLSGNARMLGVFHDAGFPVTSRFEGGVVRVEFPIAPTDEFLAASGERERRAAVASMRRLLRPSTIAVIGASRQSGSIGHALFRNLLASEFAGTVHPVNPSAVSVAGVRAYPQVSDIPGGVDLAVIVVPAAVVAAAVDQCGSAGVASLVVISAGFAETGPTGRQQQEELVRVARRHGMRMVGPNCMGIVNTADGVSMNATFAPGRPTAGRVGFLSQSGALGIAVLGLAAELGLGVSSFVSVGNKADISGNDVLQYWEADGSTDVILLYLESFGNPRKFARITRRVSRSKPIVAVKSGRTTIGARAAQSHTAAAAASDVAVDALFRQAGVIRVATMAEMFDVALVLANQPRPAGRRVAIVGNSGGPGILAADACEDAELVLAAFSDETRATLAGFLPAEASTANPVDLIASATADQYGRAVRTLLAEPGVDAVVVVFTPPLVTRTEDVEAAVAAAAGSAPDKPVVATFLAGRSGPRALAPAARDAQAPAGGRRVPAFPFPEQAVRALGHAARYGQWLARPVGVVPVLDGVDPGRAREVAAGLLAGVPAGGAWIDLDGVLGLLAAVGVPFVPSRVVVDAGGAVAAAADLGYPVALKAAGADVLHKTDVGAVALGLEDAAAVRAAWTAMADRLGGAGGLAGGAGGAGAAGGAGGTGAAGGAGAARGAGATGGLAGGAGGAGWARGAGATGGLAGGAVVQSMAEPGLETIVGVVQDPSFGPLVMFGLGGVATDVLGDVAFRILPMTDVDVAELVRSVKSAPLLFGHRGRPPVDVAALEDLLARVGALAESVPEVVELDLNPVIVTSRGALAVDARIRLRPVPAGPGPLARRLR